MDGVEILFGLENEFDITIPDEDAKSIRSIREMAAGVERLVTAKSSGGAAAQ
jgi:acyl carrier protein